MSALSQETAQPRPVPKGAVAANRVVYWLCRHWLLVFSVVWGLYVGLPWLAPVFMALGWTPAASVIYGIYATQCHQLPERSYFLFGQQATYSLDQIQAAWVSTTNPLILRQFVGNAVMGWKVAWSDRMVSMYTSVLIFGWLWAALGRRRQPLSLWAFALLALPMFVDGATHMISDFAGIGHGFRDTNAWLAALTGSAFPASFYAGDALGSFNSWMRLITGVLFGLGAAWLALPYVDWTMADSAAAIEAKFKRAGRPL